MVAAFNDGSPLRHLLPSAYLPNKKVVVKSEFWWAPTISLERPKLVFYQHLSVCLSVCLHDISNTDAPRITKRDVQNEVISN